MILHALYKEKIFLRLFDAFVVVNFELRQKEKQTTSVQRTEDVYIRSKMSCNGSTSTMAVTNFMFSLSHVILLSLLNICIPM